MVNLPVANPLNKFAFPSQEPSIVCSFSVRGARLISPSPHHALRLTGCCWMGTMLCACLAKLSCCPELFSFSSPWSLHLGGFPVLLSTVFGPCQSDVNQMSYSSLSTTQSFIFFSFTSYEIFINHHPVNETLPW